MPEPKPASSTPTAPSASKPGALLKSGDFSNPHGCMRQTRGCDGAVINVSSWKGHANYTCKCGFQYTSPPTKIYAAAKKAGLVA